MSPQTTFVSTGEQRQFTATVTGLASQLVTWSVQEGTAGGTINATGAYTAPGSAGVYHVVATATADTSLVATATVRVTLPVSCPDVEDETDVGEWQDITPVEFTNPFNLETTCVVVNPVDQSVYASAHSRTNDQVCPQCPKVGTGLYKSTDCGGTWTKVSQVPDFEVGACFFLIVDPVEPSTLYYVNGYSDGIMTLWKSTDGGSNFTPLKTLPDRYDDPDAQPPVPRGRAWEQIPTSPPAVNIIDDGSSFYISYDTYDGQPYRTATLDAPSTWTVMPSDGITRTAVSSAHDPVHHLIYGANLNAGIWRFRTQP